MYKYGSTIFNLKQPHGRLKILDPSSFYTATPALSVQNCSIIELHGHSIIRMIKTSIFTNLQTPACNICRSSLESSNKIYSSTTIRNLDCPLHTCMACELHVSFRHLQHLQYTLTCFGGDFGWTSVGFL